MPLVHETYPVAQFLSKHPGGRTILLAACGKDATADFERIGLSGLLPYRHVLV